jgi:phosphoglycerate dehydrogenase-like enzyme
MDGVKRVGGFADLLAGSDHVVLAMPLTEETRGIVDRSALRAARPGFHLVNVARGALIDDAALIEALDADSSAAATLDVTSPEPLPANHPFYRHPSIRLTPHISGSCEDGEERLSAFLARNLSRFVRREPLEGIVDPTLAY